MTAFSYARARTAEEALELAAANPGSVYLGGGTNLLDLVKEGVTRPAAVIDVSRLDLASIGPPADDGLPETLSLGATARNAATANHPLVRAHLPGLSRAILSGASGQLRNMATNGGNLVQRTRCAYFYDLSMPCNKRQPSAGCAALEGQNRNQAILGWSDACVATHPSDMAVALTALDAVVRIRGVDGGTRGIPMTRFHRLPEDTPERDTVLEPGDLVVSIDVPPSASAAHGVYLKVRERPSYAFALVSVAAAVALGPDGIITEARVALGGVAHRPWRARAAETVLVGRPPGTGTFEEAADAELNAARPLQHNAGKVGLARRALVRALDLTTSAAR